MNLTLSEEVLTFFFFKRLLKTDVPPTNKNRNQDIGGILFKKNKRVDVVLTVLNTLRVA